MISRALTRLGTVAIAMAIVLVPTVARIRQHVELRDATRLSIKHSWIGIAPPTRAVVAPQQIVVVASFAELPEPPRVRPDAVISAPELSLHPVLDLSPDPLRGPPARV